MHHYQIILICIYAAIWIILSIIGSFYIGLNDERNPAEEIILTVLLSLLWPLAITIVIVVSPFALPYFLGKKAYLKREKELQERDARRQVCR